MSIQKLTEFYIETVPMLLIGYSYNGRCISAIFQFQWSDKMYDIKRAIDNKKKSIAELTAIHTAHPGYHADDLLLEWKKELAELQRIEAIK